ncbi:hypothetical protein [Pseudoduganella plicata]|uniref:Uncharacterized protein n=1 Tax=Pseudoduganella plicata TaxID=321984 RepID=A0ABX5SB07_9BURK|nr:hypothetical protein [Pseudoduganella plicata]QBQ36742.1 hypothetical protein E1742_11620 [Pseudoduganella plicata]
MKLKVLKAVAYLPFATPAGTLVTTVGYNVETGIFAQFDAEMLPLIPAAPSQAELVDALKTLWKPWSGFRFATDNDRAAMLAAIFTAVCRPALSTAPAFFFDAPVQGSGKTKCAAALAVLTRARRAA